MSRPYFLTLTQPDGRRLALNVAHVIAISDAEPSEWNPQPTENAVIHTTIGAEQQGWHEWRVSQTFDEILAHIAALEAERDEAIEKADWQAWLHTGRFSSWSTDNLAAQCGMQGRDNLDPEYSDFMFAVAERLRAAARAMGDER